MSKNQRNELLKQHLKGVGCQSRDGQEHDDVLRDEERREMLCRPCPTIYLRQKHLMTTSATRQHGHYTYTYLRRRRGQAREEAISANQRMFRQEFSENPLTCTQNVTPYLPL